MQLDVSFPDVFFPSCTFKILCNLLLLFTFCQVCLLVKETAEIETEMAEMSSWGQANIRKKLDLFENMFRALNTILNIAEYIITREK
jgi:hypothetical protein